MQCGLVIDPEFRLQDFNSRQNPAQFTQHGQSTVFKFKLLVHHRLATLCFTSRKPDLRSVIKIHRATRKKRTMVFLKHKNNKQKACEWKTGLMHVGSTDRLYDILQSSSRFGLQTPPTFLHHPMSCSLGSKYRNLRRHKHKHKNQPRKNFLDFCADTNNRWASWILM